MKHSGPYQPRLVHEQPVLYLPATGTVITGKGIGPDWTRAAAGTVSHPAPGTTFVTQFRRTRITSAASIDNELGVRLPDVCCWRGNAAKLGGFYFSARFMVNAIPDTDIRFFAGLTAGVGAGVCVSDTVPNDTVGLWCASTHATDLKLLSRENTTTTETDLSTDVDLTAGVLYEFVMICNPGQNVIVTNLINVGTGALLNSQNITSSVTGPRNTIFLAPQCGLSNASNAVGGDTSLDIVSVYLRPNLLLNPGERA